MHLPDGLLDTKVWMGAAAVSAAGVGLCLRSGRGLGERQVPLLGVMGAGVFAAQMLNFPVLGGTSGHFLGSALLARVLGPGPAALAMTVVLLVQCLLFADGGLLALGANVLNMALVATFGGWGACRLLARLLPAPWGRHVALGIGAWLSVELAAALVAVELAWSGSVPLAVGLGAMLSWHALIGVGEAAITVAAAGLLSGPAARALGVREDA
ncbi:MAG: energy-coupling factor ABC transporter permease [Acetobacteraceae bacterium]|nr:energy-coupling factor ABC transporter permease [Acetobacteraceae bacterium]